MSVRVETALFGGSFDPVHLGHLHLIHQVVGRTNIRRFILEPVSMNNFKRERRPAPPEDRLAMLRLASSAYPSLYPEDPPLSLIVDDSEIKRGGISYTYDTVRELYGRFPIKGKLFLVMGDDLLSTLPAWHEFPLLREKVTFLVVRRCPVRPPVPEGVDAVLLPTSPRGPSASLIRDALREEGGDMSESVRSLMPKEVASYVVSHRLYRD